MIWTADARQKAGQTSDHCAIIRRKLPLLRIDGYPDSRVAIWALHKHCQQNFRPSKRRIALHCMHCTIVSPAHRLRAVFQWSSTRSFNFLHFAIAVARRISTPALMDPDDDDEPRLVLLPDSKYLNLDCIFITTKFSQH